MASTGLLSSIFVLIALLSLNIHPCSSEPSNSEYEKVNLSLYYESLCPACQAFIVENLSVLLRKENLLSIVDLHLVPYGNAHVQPPDNVTCQHGPLECYYNTIEACAIDALPNVKEQLAFIKCVEEHLEEEEDKKAWVICSRALQFDPGTIKECYESGYGDQLILRNGRETDALNPPHEYVPWVIVDGLPLHQYYANFISYVCDAYKGPPPGSCQKRTPSAENTSTYPACYANGLERVAPKPPM